MRPIAGSRRTVTTEVLHIDYADVLATAIRNERLETLLQIRAAIAAVPTKDHTRGDSWNRPDRAVSAVHSDALAAVDRMLDATPAAAAGGA